MADLCTAVSPRIFNFCGKLYFPPHSTTQYTQFPLSLHQHPWEVRKHGQGVHVNEVSTVGSSFLLLSLAQTYREFQFLNFKTCTVLYPSVLYRLASFGRQDNFEYSSPSIPFFLKWFSPWLLIVMHLLYCSNISQNTFALLTEQDLVIFPSPIHHQHRQIKFLDIFSQ